MILGEKIYDVKKFLQSVGLQHTVVNNLFALCSCRLCLKSLCRFESIYNRVIWFIAECRYGVDGIQHQVTTNFETSLGDCSGQV